MVSVSFQESFMDTIDLVPCVNSGVFCGLFTLAITRKLDVNRNDFQNKRFIEFAFVSKETAGQNKLLSVVGKRLLNSVNIY